MAPKPESETRSGLRKRNGKSISELISVLRDSFLTSDFDRIEKVLLAREERLEAELDEKEREIGALREKMAIERLGRINAELELEKLRQKKVVRSDNGFGLDCEIVVKRKKCNVDGGGDVKGGKVGILGKKERRVAALESEKGRNVCEQKKEVVGISLKTNEGGLGASEVGKIEDVIIIGSDEDEATLDKIETGNDHQSSAAAFQKNLLTGLTASIGNLKRKFVSSPKLDANVLKGLDSDDSSSSSSSSSSSPFDMDSLPLPKNKKTRTDATSLRLNSLQR
ncbi:uncharacterized protein HKW66_Vig0078770 [Vigna angularis]|uniref:Uncharacterized protein n=2 Tax=Phaseolus angularis TaxID=3914 RepID=A0A8T0K5J0_PHAAN|nr:uncharacterized protein LOC108342519 isoform X1 [Vigna angularis]KAG2394748.1 uncharacterized protein HKW66_Vig0078770 [Vigna angularis]BAT88530.1 hypothetical protein VIGAN_05205000 [Vigna angularis var. angularis]